MADLVSATPTPRRHSDGTVTWRLAFRLVPGGATTTETFDERKDAEKFGRLVDKIGGKAAREVRNASTTSAMDVPTLATWLETHLANVAASGTPGTVGEYRRMAARTWLPTLGPLPVDSITRAHVVAWIVAQRGTETTRSIRARAKAVAAQEKDPAVKIPDPKMYAPKSIKNAQGLLSDALKAAMNEDPPLIVRNVAAGVPLPSDAERPEMVILTENEFTTLYGAMPEPWRPLVALLYSTGLRWGEATALYPMDLDLDAVTPVVRVTRAWKKGDAGVYLGSPKTRRGRRTVALPGQLVPVLRALCEGKSMTDLIFTAAEGGRVTGQHFGERVWHPAIVRSGIGKTPRVHDLRHTHASQMIAAGMDLLKLQHRLGHESLKTTGDTYGHLMPDAHTAGAAFATISLAGALPEIEPDEDEPKQIGA